MRKIINKSLVALIATVLLNSCISYRIGTSAQEGSDTQHVKTKSLFWGLVAGPPMIATPICDTLGSMGMSEIRFRRSAGQSLLSLVTLGIYNQSTIEYKCGKPCPKTSNPL